MAPSASGGWSESPGVGRGQGCEFLKGFAAKKGVILSLDRVHLTFWGEKKPLGLKAAFRKEWL